MVIVTSLNVIACPAARFVTPEYGQQILSQRGYVRGGHLLWVSYTRGDGHAPYRVDIQTQTQTDGRYYPHGYASRDSHDQVVVQYTQTFWSKKLITDIKIRGGEALGPPEERPLLWTYTLAQRYAGADLVLESLQRQDGEETTLPPTTFIYHELVSYRDSQGDGKEYKHWLAEIHNGYGGGVAFNLSTPDSFQNGQTANPHADSEGRYWYRYRVRKVSTWLGVATVPGTRTHYQYLDTDGTQHDGT